MSGHGVWMRRWDTDDAWAETKDVSLIELLGALTGGFAWSGGHVVTVVREKFQGYDGLKLTVGDKNGTYSVWFITEEQVTA